MSANLREAISECSSIEEAARQISDRAQHMEEIAWEELPTGQEHADWEAFLDSLPTSTTCVQGWCEGAAQASTASTDELIVEPESEVEQEQATAQALVVLRDTLRSIRPKNPEVKDTLNVWTHILEQTASYPPPSLLTPQQLATVEQSRSPIWRYRKIHLALTFLLAISTVVFGVLLWKQQQELQRMQVEFEKHVLVTSLVGSGEYIVEINPLYPLLFRFGDDAITDWRSFDVDGAILSINGRIERMVYVEDERGQRMVRVQFDSKYAGTVYLRNGTREGVIDIPRTWYSDQWHRAYEAKSESFRKLDFLTEVFLMKLADAYAPSNELLYSFASLRINAINKLYNEHLKYRSELEEQLAGKGLSDTERRALQRRLDQLQELMEYLDLIGTQFNEQANEGIIKVRQLIRLQMKNHEMKNGVNKKGGVE